VALPALDLTDEMIKTEEIHTCRTCQSTNVVRNGRTKAGKQNFKCNECNSLDTLELSPPYSEPEKEQILAALQERASF
jgi:transposase-like protein